MDMTQTLSVLLLLASQALAQGQADIERYLGIYSNTVAGWDKLEAGKRPTLGEINIQELLPIRRPFPFAAYIMSTRSFSSAVAGLSLAQSVAAGQLNKMVSSSPQSSGTTSLLSSSATTDVLSLAVEYGAITEAGSGNDVTLRANAVGVAGLFAGDPYLGCYGAGSTYGCTRVSQVLRGLSASVSIETNSSNTRTISGTNAATGTPATANILSGAYRMDAWNVRFDLNHKTVYDGLSSEAVQNDWATGIRRISLINNEDALATAVGPLIQDLEAIPDWRRDILDAIQQAPMGPGQIEGALKTQLDQLIMRMRANDPDKFDSKVEGVYVAYQSYFNLRDGLIRSLQSNKFSLEYNGTHPLGQPNRSNIRLIYSYQVPTKAMMLITVNGAAEWYDSAPMGVKVGRFRDLQAAAQLDRQLGNIPSLGRAAFTAAYYFQWMKDNALITFPLGNTAPGTGITPPGATSTLLAAKGDIHIVQAKVTVPIKGGILKIPVSFTWSNRTELINESEKRGQIGLSLNLDSVFAK